MKSKWKTQENAIPARSVLVAIRLTPDERRELQSLADAARKTISSYIRYLVLESKHEK